MSGCERSTSRITPREHGDRIPTSFGQARLWFMDQLDGDRTDSGSAYAVPIPLRLRGDLDVDALRASLDELISRHEVLRTTYEAGADAAQPMQVVRPATPIDLPLTDLTAMPEADAQQAVMRAVHEQETTPFDLAAGPVIRARLLRLGTAEHVLVCAVHHIAIDATSLGLLHAELAAGYNRRALGTGEPPRPLEVQYADYATWQRERIAGAEGARMVEFWRRELDGAATLDLPTDRPVPDVPSSRGGYRTLPLDERVVDGLDRLAAAEDTTGFAVLAAAMSALLARYTGQTDVTIGTTVPERHRPELRALIGAFANTIVLRTDVGGAPTFRDLLRRMRRAVAAAEEHAELPFDTVVRELSPERSGSRKPLFRVYLGMDRDIDVLPEFAGLEAETIAPDFATAKFDIGFGLHLGPRGAVLDSGFATDLFDEATVDRMLRHFATVLAAAVADPDRPVATLPMLTAAEQHAALVEWNATERPFPADRCLHQLFEANVDAHGDRTAVVCDGDELTYRELEERANRLAHRLRRDGVRRGSVVGLCLPRGLDMAVATLATLKAGAAYLPLDPAYPASRLAFMVGDVGCWGVLTHETLRERVAEADRAGTTVVCLDTWDCSGEPATRPDVGADPADLAYVIFTSGSTGEPKGIALRHRGAVNNFTDFNDRFAIGEADRVLAVSSPSFDMSVYDLLGMLGAGGTVVLPAGDLTREPAEWVRLMQVHEVTVWHSAPALLELLLEHLPEPVPATLPRLRLALLGGDWIPVNLPDRLRTAAPGVTFVSLGGATEASMDSLVYVVSDTDPAWTSIPYGRPMANQRAYVLDANLQPLPVGVPGELHLAGTGLAVGYVNRPELTAERFVETVLPSGHTERLYRTGDLARYRPDGVLELLGRMDHQVKIHGLRIELGEIEATLRRHEAVRDAAVVARGERGHHTLAGFVQVADDVDTVEIADRLREWLGIHLPAHMVPGSLGVLDRFPTTPNGKVDRIALAALEVVSSAAGQAPRDEWEERVAAAWREVLGVSEVGIDDNFFHLGGDSFAAVRTVAALDGAVPVVEMFKFPTIRTLAASLRSESASTALLHELTPAGRDAELTVVCVPYGGGNAAGYQSLADALSDRFALWAVGLPGHGPGSGDTELLSFDEAARRCAEEVVERITGPVIVYGHCAGSWLALDVARRLEDLGADLRGTYVGAALPDPDPAKSLIAEKQTSDREWADHLRTLGGLDGPLGWGEIEQIMRAGRSDHVGAVTFQLRCHNDPPRRLHAPLHCLYGGDDPGVDCTTPVPAWGLYARTLTRSVIPGGSHYFIHDRATELAELLDVQHPSTPLIGARAETAA